MLESPKGAAMFTGAKNVIRGRGDDIWGVLCDNLPVGKPFSTMRAAQVLIDEYGHTYSTARQYVRAVLQSVYDNQDGEDRAVWKPSRNTWRI